MQSVHEDALLRAVADLVAIPSTLHDLGELRRALDFIAEMIWEANPDITIERFESNGKPSLLAYRGGQRPDKFHIVLNGHVDVVPGTPEQYSVVVRDDKLYGRGVYDMKAACVVLTSLFCEFVDKVPYTLGLQIVTDEEPGGFDGALHQLEQGVRADFVVCGECGRTPDVFEIANETKGIVFADVTLNGRSSHGAYPWQGDNVVLHASRFIHALHDAYPSPLSVSQDSTITVTSMTSTTGVHNKTPEEALLKLDCRFTPGDPHFTNEKAFRDFIRSIDETAHIKNIHVFSNPMQSDPHNEFLNLLKTSAEEVEGHAFSYARRSAGSDGRHFLPYGGQACEFGIAGRDQHGDGECITIKAFQNYIDTMRLFLEKTRHPDTAVIFREGPVETYV
jgi:succinyl-diaminopimelate desuccinylase